MKYKDAFSVPLNEKNLLFCCDNLFLDEIKNRGTKYYYDNKVLNLYKNKNHYYAKVKGSNINPYEVEIIFNPFDLIFKCNCPCTFHCKHEYATILAIHNHDYCKIHLKPEIKEKEETLKEIIKRIPASKLKEYILSYQGQNKVIFEENAFKSHFSAYYHFASYDFYYNNLYNNLLLNNDESSILNDYLNKAKNYLENHKYSEVVKIITAIINAYRDNNYLDSENLINNIPKISMYLRITFRKSNPNEQRKIKLWIKELEQKSFYHNLYIEDIIHSLKNIK